MEKFEIYEGEEYKIVNGKDYVLNNLDGLFTGITTRVPRIYKTTQNIVEIKY